MSDVRILSFGYDANVFDFMGRPSLNNLLEHISDLLSDLARIRRDTVSSRSSRRI
jgi:hypothetical protein